MGPGDEPDTAVAIGDPPGTIAPGERLVLRVPVEFESLAIGDHVVSGEVAAPGSVAPFEVSLGIQPWGLYIVIGVAVVAGVVVAILWRLRRRRHAEPAAVTEAPEAPEPVAAR